MPEVNPSKGRKSLIVYKYGSRRVLGERPSSYDAASIFAHHLFVGLPVGHRLVFQTDELEACEGQLTDIPQLFWDEIIPQVSSLTVGTLESVRLDENLVSVNLIYPPVSKSGVQEYRVSVCIKADGLTINIRTTYSTTVEDLQKFVLQQLMSDFEELDWKLAYQGHRCSPDQTMGDLGVEDEDTMDLVRVYRGGKPVIYLFPPETVEASVKLSLVPQWSLSAIYPVVPIKPSTADSNEEVSWRVRANPNGDMTELATGLDVAYLFWEALTNPATPMSLPVSPIEDSQIEVFEPNKASLNSLNSVVLSTDKITLYIDKALLALGLHTEARTSFITYWLPSILKHKNVALRFLPQVAYERAAPLQISPKPDVVTRVFMLFRGIKDEDLAEWGSAKTRATEDIIWWRGVVGVDLTSALDKSLFRVLEWGGMEVR